MRACRVDRHAAPRGGRRWGRCPVHGPQRRAVPVAVRSAAVCRYRVVPMPEQAIQVWRGGRLYRCSGGSSGWRIACPARRRGRPRRRAGRCSGSDGSCRNCCARLRGAGRRRWGERGQAAGAAPADAGAQPGVSVRDGEGLQAGGGEAVQRQEVGSCDDYRVVRRAEESRDSTEVTQRTVVTRTIRLYLSRFSAPANTTNGWSSCGNGSRSPRSLRWRSGCGRVVLPGSRHGRRRGYRPLGRPAPARRPPHGHSGLRGVGECQGHRALSSVDGCSRCHGVAGAEHPWPFAERSAKARSAARS